MGAALVATTSLLSGCAGARRCVGHIAAEPMTESDEPEIRKRARLRTTLATSYFDQGQDKVALDEIKQALAADPNYGPAYVLARPCLHASQRSAADEESFRALADQRQRRRRPAQLRLVSVRREARKGSGGAF